MGKEAMSYIISIMQNTERMGLLIQNLLNLSQSGKDALNIELVDMNHTVQFVLAMQEEEDKNSTKNINVKKLKAMDCDMALIKQVWSNLISNAIKYTSKTKNPMIEIGSMLKNKETVYYVKDNGTGFNMKFAHKLFKIFHRLHAKDEFAGIGVGLALVHRIITKHGGKVWADAKVGMGATFYFTIGSKPKK